MSRAQSGGDGGVSVTTLVIASCSAAVATVAVPLFWEKGTLIAAAVTPIVIAVVSELLRKPVERIGAVGVRRQTFGGTAIGERDPPQPAEQPFEPLSAAERVELPEVWSGDRHVYYERPRRRLVRRQLKIALVTGVLGFVLAAAFVTASELALFGKSVSQADRRTTFFGGGGSDRSDKRDEQAQPSPTPSEQTPTPTPTRPRALANRPRRRRPARPPASSHRRLHPPRPRARANRPRRRRRRPARPLRRSRHPVSPRPRPARSPRLRREPTSSAPGRATPDAGRVVTRCGDQARPAAGGVRAPMWRCSSRAAWNSSAVTPRRLWPRGDGGRERICPHAPVAAPDPRREP